MAVLNVEHVRSRFEGFVRHFKDNSELYENATSLSIVDGKRDEERDTMTAALHLHLLEFEFPETIMILTRRVFYVLASDKKLGILRPAADAINADGEIGVRVELMARNKADNDKENFSKLIDALKDAGGDRVARIADEPGRGSLADAWREALERADGIQLVEAGRGVENLLAHHDSRGQEMLRAASQLTVKLLKNVFVRTMEQAFEDNKTVTHNSLAEKVEKALDKVGDYGLGSLEQEQCDVSVMPLVQSGGRYALRLDRAGNDSRNLSPDVVLFSWGGRYRGYSSFCARTYLIDPSDSLNRCYNTLMEGHAMLLNELKSGAVIADVVKGVEAYLREKLPPGAQLPQSFGYGIGLLSREGSLTLTSNNRTRIEPGMAFVVQSSFEAVPIPDAKPGTAIAKIDSCALVLADTVVVLSESAAEPNMVLTRRAKRELQDVSYELGDEEDEEEEEEEEKDDGRAAKRSRRAAAGAGGVAGRDASGRSARLRERAAMIQGGEDENRKRDEHQKELMNRVIEDGKRRKERLLSGQKGDEDKKEERVEPIRAYDSGAEFPHSALPNRITVDRSREAVLLPIRGQLVPFHISTIKSVAKTEEGADAFVRFNFHTPQQTAGKDCPPAMVQAMTEHGPQFFWVKTLNFRCQDHRNMNLQVQLIKDMQKRKRAAVEQEREEADLVEQPKLIIDRTQRVPRLKGLNMFPVLSGRKCVGALEAHSNGFRFRTDRGEHLDIIYSNIKHALFQPCKQEHYVILHFHLKYPIMVGKKKRKDIQFFTEVIVASEALAGQARSVHDPDGLEEENREKQLQHRINQSFRAFVQQVSRSTSCPPFDELMRDLGFYGVPQKEMVYILPGTNVLAALTDRPPFVLSMDDVEHVHFERVIFSAKNFDMVLALKEGRAPKGADEFVRINAIDMKELPNIKQWLDSVMEITYTQGVSTMNWRSIMKDIVRDEFFYESHDEDGEAKWPGWKLFADDEAAGEEEGEKEEDAESNFSDELNEEEEEESEAGSDDEEFDEMVDSEEESEEEEEEEGESDPEGADWDELERRAKEDDRRRDMIDMEQDRAASSSRKRGRVAGGGGARPAKRQRR